MNALSFGLALGAIGLPVAWLVSAASLAVLPLVRRLSPVARAEVSAWWALVPLFVACALVAAVSVPSVLYGLGLGLDHCTGHEHHPHICAWHGAVLPAWLAWLGAVGWATFAFRLAQVGMGLVRRERLVASLAALGVPREGILVVPATIAVCHAVGLIRPRVLVSRSVVDRLDEREYRAVVAHERAHIDRSDPLWSAILAFAGCVTPFAGTWTAVWRAASEEAADDVAAAVTDGPTVARALVTVARMRLDDAPGFAFGAAGLEHRVTRLLGSRAEVRESRVHLGAWAMAAMVASAAGLAHEHLHHGVEEAWEFAIRE